MLVGQSKGRDYPDGVWLGAGLHNSCQWSVSPFPVQFLQQTNGGPAQLPIAVLGGPRAMYWASLRGSGSRLRAQGGGLELEVVQAGDVHLQGWMGMEGEGKVSTPLCSSSKLPLGMDGDHLVCRESPPRLANHLSADPAPQSALRTPAFGLPAPACPVSVSVPPGGGQERVLVGMATALGCPRFPPPPPQ